jgi:ATP-binding cassette subfamily C (CFTR/MRP) protein 1
LDADDLQPDAREIIPKSDLCAGDVVCYEEWFYVDVPGDIVSGVRNKDGEFSWSKDAQSPSLEGINLIVRKGELTGIVGRVGAGKVCLYHDV